MSYLLLTSSLSNFFEKQQYLVALLKSNDVHGSVSSFKLIPFSGILHTKLEFVHHVIQNLRLRLVVTFHY